MGKIRKFAGKHVILFAVLLVVIIMLLYNFSGYIIPITDENQLLQIPLSIFKICLAVLTMAYLWFFGYCDYRILQFKGFKKFATIVSPVAAIILIELIFTMVISWKNITVKNFILYIIGLLAIGIFEEFLFRVGVLQIFLSKWHHNEKELEKAAAGSGILFGLTHMTNVFAGNASAYVVGQIIMAAVIGYVLSVIYIITKNVWGCVLSHALFDSVSMFSLIFGRKDVQSTVETVQYSLGKNTGNTFKDIALVVVFYIIVVLFAGVLLKLGRQLLHMSKDLAMKEDRTKQEEFMMKLFKIEEYPIPEKEEIENIENIESKEV